MRSSRRAGNARTVRIPGTGRLEEGMARKVLIPEGEAAPPREIILIRWQGRLFALDSLCPHEGGRIAEGPLWEGRWAYCPLHLCKFDPRDGSAVGAECGTARTYPVSEKEGHAELRLPVHDGGRDGGT